MLLYPGVDSLNHNPLTQNIWRSDENGFGIVVRDELRSGMEVYNPYGGKSNGECKSIVSPLYRSFVLYLELAIADRAKIDIHDGRRKSRAVLTDADVQYYYPTASASKTTHATPSPSSYHQQPHHSSN